METKAVEYIVLPNFETAQFESYILFHLISVFCHVVVLHLKHANTQRCLLRHLLLNKWRVISLTHTHTGNPADLDYPKKNTLAGCILVVPYALVLAAGRE